MVLCVRPQSAVRKGLAFGSTVAAVLLLAACDMTAKISPSKLLPGAVLNRAPSTPASFSCSENPAGGSTGNICTLVEASVTDLDGRVVTYLNASSTCPGVVVDPSNGYTTFTAPARGANCFMRVRAFDGVLYSGVVSSSIVRGSNNAPVAIAQVLEARYPGTTSITLLGTDLEQDALTFTVVRPPAHGSLSGTAPNLVYTPIAPFSPTDSLLFEVSDGTSESEVTSVTLNLSDDSGFDSASSRMTGVAWKAPEQVLALGSNGSCDGALTNCSSLDSSWTPKWTSLWNYWTLDETWADALGGMSLNPGVSPTFVTGAGNAKIGSGALSFDGTGQDVSATLAHSLTLSSDFSVSLWLKPDPTFDNPADTITKPLLVDCSTGYALNLWYSDQGTGTPGTLTAYRHNGTDTSGVFTPNGALSKNIYYHLVFTKSGTLLKLYLDGDLVSTGTDFIPVAATCSSFSLGLSRYKGLIDDVALWGAALSDSEVQTIYSRQAPAHAGAVTSVTFDAGHASVWNGLSWFTTLPFGKELPGGGSSEVSTDYPSITSNLMSGNLGLWHLNETDISLHAAIHDSSGNAADASVVDATAISVVTGRLGGAIERSGYGGPYISVPAGAASNYTDEMSVQYWMRGTGTTTIYSAMIGNWGTYPCWDIKVTATGELMPLVGQNGSHYDQFFATRNVFDGRWHHVVMTLNRGDGVLYVDGSQDIAFSYFHGTGLKNDVDAMYILKSVTDGRQAMDEVALWSRALSAAEVIQLYRRGANRVRFQARTCASAACGDNPDWFGGGGNNQTYFSELQNNSSLSASGDPIGNLLNSVPELLFSSFISLTVPDNRYFQYRAILESDDESVTPASPELQSVTLVP